MKTRSKPPSRKAPKPGPAKGCDDIETTTFAASLRHHGQLHVGDDPLPPGTTHVVEKAAEGKPGKLTRKRFSAF